MNMMEFIAEITDEGLGLKEHKASRYFFRRAVRAVVFNNEGKVALIHATRVKYFMLLGGGIEKEESIRQALRREMLEEIGYSIRIGKPIGVIVERRSRERLLQVSYCFIAYTKGKEREKHLTMREKAMGFKVDWVSVNEAMRMLNSIKDSTRRFGITRNTAFLKKAKQIMKH